VHERYRQIEYRQTDGRRHIANVNCCRYWRGQVGVLSEMRWLSVRRRRRRVAKLATLMSKTLHGLISVCQKNASDSSRRWQSLNTFTCCAVYQDSSEQWRRYTRARQVKWPVWKIHRPGSALPSPAYCFASVIVWTENKNVTVSDRFVCLILTVKWRWRPVFWGWQLKRLSTFFVAGLRMSNVLTASLRLMYNYTRFRRLLNQSWLRLRRVETFLMPPPPIIGGERHCVSRWSVRRSVVRPLTHLHDATLSLLSEEISNTAQIFVMWVGIVEKVFKVAGQRSRSYVSTTETYIATVLASRLIYVFRRRVYILNIKLLNDYLMRIRCVWMIL